jgi:hypothetical protein
VKNPSLGSPLIREPKQDDGFFDVFEGITHEWLPSSASQVPFLWDYLGQNFAYQFVAGVLTIEQDPTTRALRPRIGWAVRPAPGAN